MEFQEKAKRHLRERLRVAKEDLQRNPDDYHHRLDVVRFSELLAELEENRNSGQQGSLNPLEFSVYEGFAAGLKGIAPDVPGRRVADRHGRPRGEEHPVVRGGPETCRRVRRACR